MRDREAKSEDMEETGREGRGKKEKKGEED